MILLGDQLTFCVCTYNSSKTLERCLASVRRISPQSRLLIVDHHSEDNTAEIARRFNSEVFLESNGLGYARQLCLDLTQTEYVVFVDGDVEILRKDFFDLAGNALQSRQIGAVVGMAIGHRFAYGIPASLLVLRKRDFSGAVIPQHVNHRETWFIQRRLDDLGLKTYYIFHSIRHSSQFRKFKPELIGANTRTLPSPAYKELGFALKVIVLLSLNSKNAKNLIYIPIFYIKFVRGFSNPDRWFRVKRIKGGE